MLPRVNEQQRQPNQCFAIPHNLVNRLEGNFKLTPDYVYITPCGPPPTPQNKLDTVYLCKGVVSGAPDGFDDTNIYVARDGGLQEVSEVQIQVVHHHSVSR